MKNTLFVLLYWTTLSCKVLGFVCEKGGKSTMQVHISPSMRTITISTSNGFLDFMKVKVAARHLSYRTIFYTMLMLAVLLPFIFILMALVKLEGVDKCSSLDCLSRRLGPRLLGRADPSSRLAKDIYEVLSQVSNEDLPEGFTVPESFNDLVADMKMNQYDAKTFAFKMKALEGGLNRFRMFISLAIRGLNCGFISWKSMLFPVGRQMATRHYNSASKGE